MGDGVGLVGRAPEIAVLAALCGEARNGRAGVVEVVGEPGVGKTALLEATAAGWGKQVVRASGVQDEAHLPFAALSELLRPLRALGVELSTGQRAAVGGLLDLGGWHATADPYALGAATLALIALAAEEAPLLVVIDDVHWVDEVSGTVLSFALRRLGADAVAVLLARRPGERGPVTGPWPELVLRGLDRDATVALLGPGVAPGVATGLHQATGGNPLALRELQRTLTADELNGRAELPDPLPLGEHGMAAFGSRIATLPMATRLALAVIVAAGPGGSGLVAEALRRIGVTATDLGAAERADLLVIDGGQPWFPHPLVRAAAYTGVDAPNRRRVHAALAETCPGDVARHARHLAAAAVLPDEQVAAALERAAVDAEARGGPAAAISAAVAASRLTPDGRMRDVRRLRAAEVCALAGRRGQAVVLAEQVLAASRDVELRHRALALRATSVMWTEGVSRAVPMMRATFDELAGPAPDLAALVAIELSVALAGTTGMLPQAAAMARQACTLPVRDPLVHAFARHRYANAAAWCGDLRAYEEAEADTALSDLRRAAPGKFAAQHLMSGQYLLLVERFEEARRVADDDVAAARAAAPSLLPSSLMMRADLALHCGDTVRARADLDEALDLGPEVGVGALMVYAHAMRARTAALEGDVTTSSWHADTALDAAREQDMLPAQLYVAHARGLLELARGAPAAAANAYAVAAELAQRTGMRSPTGVPWHADRVEALHAADRLDEAADALADLQALGAGTGSRFARAAAARCQALLGDPDWPDLYAGALADQHDLPLERGRTHLAYGVRLRRERRVREAREHLAAASDVLSRFGATPWAARARAELRAAGVTLSDTPARTALSAQELRVCLAVAEGATNREAAAALLLSPKTVEYHLGKAFTNLGVTNRAQLARLAATGGLGMG